MMKQLHDIWVDERELVPEACTDCVRFVLQFRKRRNWSTHVPQHGSVSSREGGQFIETYLQWWHGGKNALIF